MALKTKNQKQRYGGCSTVLQLHFLLWLPMSGFPTRVCVQAAGAYLSCFPVAQKPLSTQKGRGSLKGRWDVLTVPTNNPRISAVHSDDSEMLIVFVRAQSYQEPVETRAWPRQSVIPLTTMDTQWSLWLPLILSDTSDYHCHDPHVTAQLQWSAYFLLRVQPSEAPVEMRAV